MYPSNGNIINVLALTQIRVAAEGIRCGAACSEIFKQVWFFLDWMTVSNALD